MKLFTAKTKKEDNVILTFNNVLSVEEMLQLRGGDGTKDMDGMVRD